MEIVPTVKLTTTVLRMVVSIMMATVQTASNVAGLVNVEFLTVESVQQVISAFPSCAPVVFASTQEL